MKSRASLRALFLYQEILGHASYSERHLGVESSSMFSLFRKRDQNIDRQASARLRILHLGFEDFRKPGNGGGSIRTYEINRRIAKQHDVTVLVTKFKGYQDRTEDGVRYIHVGLPLGYFGGILSYFAVLPFVARKYKADLVVEDFAAPFSSCLSPLWTRSRTIAMVQWLNAREKSQQYHLPFWITEKIGTRIQDNYIAVSHDLAEKITQANPMATVTVVGNGVPATAFKQPLYTARKDILYVGRLERAQKGLDLLIAAFAKIVDHTDANLVLVGNGPDEKWARSYVKELGLTNRVIFKGRVNGKAKDALFTKAKIVAMPSRFETFGMVAIEGLAGGAPVIAFDIPCLREVVPQGLGIVVPAFEVDQFVDALMKELSAKPDKKLEAKRRAFAKAYDWDTLAKEQEHVYMELLKAHLAPNESRSYES
jgi:glycosyltransferase involved in cell wall biosynthesis